MKQKPVFVVSFVLVIIALAGGLYLYANSQQTPTTTSALTGCRAKTFTMGSSGQCVKDIQTMTDYMETAGLTECPFRGSKLLPISGTYDAATTAQVKVIQNWADCYYKQESLNMSVTTSGNVDNGTWTELCDYAYNSPKETNATISSYTQASITAGKDAGC